MIFSRITLYHTQRGWQCRIEHDGYVVKSGRHSLAYNAYNDAESRLVCKPGYVSRVAKEDRG